MKIVLLLLILSVPSFAQKIYFNTYETASQKYSVRVWNDGVTERKFEGVFLGKNWKLFESKLFGVTSNEIQEYDLAKFNSHSRILYKTNNFIQDFAISANSIFTIEAPDEQSLLADSKFFCTSRQTNKKVEIKAVSKKNIIAISASHYSEDLAVIEKNEENFVLGMYTWQNQKYKVLQMFELSGDGLIDLNIHNKILWIAPEKIALLVKKVTSKDWDIYEFDFRGGSKATIPLKVGRVIDFDFYNNEYFVLIKDSIVKSLGGQSK